MVPLAHRYWHCWRLSGWLFVDPLLMFPSAQVVTSQKRKNINRQDRMTCQPKPNPGPVNRIRTVALHSMINARIWRTRLLKKGLGSMVG